MKFLFGTIFLFLIPNFTFAQPCQYLAHEPFEYSQVQTLHAQEGGFGWASPWEIQDANVSIPGYQLAPTLSLDWQSLKVDGGHASGGKLYLSAGRNLDTRTAGPFAKLIHANDPRVGSAKGTGLWISFVLRKEKNDAFSCFAGLHADPIAWCDNCTQDKIQAGYFEGKSEVNGQRRWTLRIGETYLPTGISIQAGKTTLLVLRIGFNEGSTDVQLWVDPVPIAGNPPAATMSHTADRSLAFRSFGVYLGNDPGEGAVDEIRLAESYACVTPDINTAINLPPVLRWTVLPSDGQAPLLVNFNASGSYDPEGGLLEYRWNFGDGSSEVFTATTNHTFNRPGIHFVTLEAKDPSGLSKTATIPITVRNAENSFPCESIVTMIRAADCSGNGAMVRVLEGPSEHQLKNATGNVIPANGRDYGPLSPGIYQFTIEGNSGCRDAFTWHIAVDSSTCPDWQAPVCLMDIGTNLSGFADWVPERPLRNLMKHVRPEPVVFDDECNCWDNGMLSQIQLNGQGYPTHVPQLVQGKVNKFRYVLSTEGANLPSQQRFRMQWKGSGKLSLHGPVQMLQETENSFYFLVTEAGNIFFHIILSDAADPVRDVVVLRDGDDGQQLEEKPFYSGFLEKIRPFKALRFMDWGATNNNPVVAWMDRTPMDYFTYGTKHGVPYELMIQLANETRKDVWICVPHAANELYVQEMARLFLRDLDPALNIYLEYSNEVWNWIFQQAHYNVENAPPGQQYGRAMAEKADRTFKIWHAVYGPSKSRVKRVLGLQAGFNWLNQHILSHLPQDAWDYASPTSYLGLDHEDTAIPSLYAGSTAEDVLQNARNHWATYRPALKEDYNNILLYGKGILNYEGGQHFVGNVFGNPYPYQQAMWDAQYHPGIHALYNDMLDTIRNWGSRLFGNFSLSSAQESVYGSWGVLNDIDVKGPYFQTAPKYQALLDNLCEQTVSSKQRTDAPPLTIYPNPTEESITVQWPEEAGTNAPWLLCNLAGTTVEQGVTNAPLIDLDHLPPGLYVLRLYTSKGQWQALVVKT